MKLKGQVSISRVQSNHEPYEQVCIELAVPKHAVTRCTLSLADFARVATGAMVTAEVEIKELKP